jgi:xanthine dehydrogenase accessory factor
VIHGDAPIALAVTRLAEDLGYATVPWTGDQLPADAIAVVVAAHGRDEAPLLTAAVRAGVAYVGLVASPRRGTAVVSALDLSDDERARIRTPAGLDINARTPGEVALSILAEIVPILPRRSTSDAGEPPSESVSGSPTAIDPVCGMAVATVDASLHVDHGDRRYWFCGSGCRTAFVADPGAFLRS